jgi:hypothetical protein
VIIVNHAVSEETGINNLSNFLRQSFPAIPIHHIFQGCPYRLIQDAEP